MRDFTLLSFLLSSLVLSLGCNGGGGDGSGGTAGTGGTGGGGANGGEGGIGGMGGAVRTCVNPRDCDDQEPCTRDLCEDRICAYEPLADQAICVSDTGISACLGGTCQAIWTTCSEDLAMDGDFCRPTPEPDPPRLGKCDSGACAIEECQIDFDCWSGDACEVGFCESSTGECTLENAPNGNACIPPVGGRCFDGTCRGGGAGGQGGAGGAAGGGGEGGSAGRGGSAGGGGQAGA